MKYTEKGDGPFMLRSLLSKEYSLEPEVRDIKTLLKLRHLGVEMIFYVRNPITLYYQTDTLEEYCRQVINYYDKD